MKSITKLAVAALLALVSTGMASASTTVIYITGSTAYRVSCVTAEAAYLASLNGGSYANVKGTAFGTSFTGSNQSVLFAPSGANTLVLDNDFTGSIAGLIGVSGAAPTAAFPTYTSYVPGTATVGATTITAGSAPSTPASGGTLVAAGSVVASAQTPSLALCDSTLTSANTILTSNGLSALTNLTLTTVGVVPFKFVASVGTPSDVTNITPEAFNELYYGAGKLPAAYLSGNNADESSILYALGRDVDSGTRANALAETNPVTGLASTPSQWAPFDSTSAASADTDTTHVVGNTGAGSAINGLNYYPDETVDGIDSGTGGTGYASGGNLAKAMFATNNLGGNAHFIAYLGISDAASAIGGGARELSYNGSFFSAATVQEGQYTYWGYEHAARLTSDTTGVQGVVNGIVSQLNGGLDEISSGGPTFLSMRVNRTDDGQNIGISYTPTYPY